MNKQINEPAFPSPRWEGWGSPQEGMALRDYFAAKAMQGILSDSSAVDEETGKKITIPDDAEAIAIGSYMMADAMLKARNN